MIHSLLKAAWMLEALFMANQSSPASSGHSKDGSLWGDFFDVMICFKRICWPMIQSSETAPTQGTTCFYPDVLLSNAYMILRPFFSPTVPSNSKDVYDANNWKFGKSWNTIALQYSLDDINYKDITTPDFPGIKPARGGGYRSPKFTSESHPHLRLEECMVSAPKVNPGDAVFWHCDVIHSVDIENTGSGDSAGKNDLPYSLLNANARIWLLEK